MHLVETAMYGQHPAWHGVGTVIPEDTVTSKQALVLAGLDWLVEDAALTVAPGVAVDGWKAIVRCSDHKLLGVVTDSYRSFQNWQAFQLMDDLVQSGDALVHTAGSLDGGRRVWMLYRVPGTMKIADGEEMAKFIFLASSHDASLALTAAFTPTRIVCNNTLNMALGGVTRSYRVEHTSGIVANAADARKALGIGYRYFDELERVGRDLLAVKVSDRSFQGALDQVVPIPTKKNSGEKGYRAYLNAQREQEAIRSIYLDAPDQQNIRGTGWGFVNAVAAFSDHGINSHDTPRNSAAGNRMRRIIFDPSLKDRAMAAVLANN